MWVPYNANPISNRVKQLFYSLLRESPLLREFLFSPCGKRTVSPSVMLIKDCISDSGARFFHHIRDFCRSCQIHSRHFIGSDVLELNKAEDGFFFRGFSKV